MNLFCPVKKDPVWLYHFHVVNRDVKSDNAHYLWYLNNGNNLRQDFKGDENPIYNGYLNQLLKENETLLTEKEVISSKYQFNKSHVAILNSLDIAKLKEDLGKLNLPYTIKYLNTSLANKG